MIENGGNVFGENTGMKRDKKLLELLLREVEGEDPRPDLSPYTQQQQADHLAQLIQMGYAEGRVVLGNEGEVAAARATSLTPAGHDFIERLRLEKAPSMKIELFISHNSKDVAIAEALIDLFRSALVMPAETIRCTSVNGYRLSAGASTDDQLRQEVHEAKAFIGIVTPNSLKSAYVLFELGARWGARRHLAPLLALGVDPKALGKPLENLNALQASDTGQVQQLVTEVSRVLGREPQPPAVYQKNVDAVVQLSGGDVQAPVPASQSDRAPVSAEELEYLSKRMTTSTPPPIENHFVADENDALSLIESWLDSNMNAALHSPIKFFDVDTILNLVPGTAERLLEKAAVSKNLVVRRKGGASIMFQPASQEFGRY